MSKYLHCLADLLHRHADGELACDIPLIISNHPDARRLSEFHQVPFYFVPIEPDRKAEAERRQMHEVMRGYYDALVLVDVSRQGGEPGTLYVIEPDPDEIEPISDGEVVSPHGMDPKTVLRFVKTVGGWPGKIVMVACEPAAGDEMGLELTPEVAAVVDRAADLVLETIAELRTDAAYAERP